jgi:ribosomal protein L7/L12
VSALRRRTACLHTRLSDMSSAARCVHRIAFSVYETTYCAGAVGAGCAVQPINWVVAGGGTSGQGAVTDSAGPFRVRCRHIARLRGRDYVTVPQPDPEENPEPSQRVIDIVDAIENLTVKEAIWLCKLQKERFGITDADLGMMPMGYAPAGAPATAPAAEAPAAEEKPPEKTEFDVIIDSYDTPSKIKIIKEVRAVLPELGLKQAKELVRVHCASQGVLSALHERRPRAARMPERVHAMTLNASSSSRPLLYCSCCNTKH